MDYNRGSQWDNYNKMETQTIEIESRENEKHIATYLSKVYAWMFGGLLLTAIVAFYTASNEALINYLVTNRLLFFGLIIGQFAMVGYLMVRIQKMTLQTATMVFLLYAALNGLVFGLLLMIYTTSSIASTFAITAGTFAVMSVVGYTTKTDLTSFGKLMLMGLIGIIIGSIVNFFLKSPAMYYIISYVGVAVFVGLIAYDTQKIKSYALIPDIEMRKKAAIIGALALYLDFINLFLMLLRLFGRRD